MPRKGADAKNAPLHQFSVRFFWYALILVLIVVGVHTGIIVGMNALGWAEIIQVHMIVFYWIAVVGALTVIARRIVSRSYEAPLSQIIDATEAVAKGDFSVRIPTVHERETYDYFDYMILDLNRMIEELNSIETLKTDFISNVSHEMKTPLAVIRNYAELLQAEEITEERRLSCAAAIEEASVKLTALVANILRLNRLENQSIAPEKTRFDVSRQIADCILQFEDRWEEKNLTMNAELEDSAYIAGDEELLTLVWNNLISNAIKFTPAGGTVTARQTSVCEKKNARVVVAISDTGCGMDAETMKHIFDRFYQGDTSHATEGNGLGLALVKRVVDLSDGVIDVESAVGAGSTFTVTLSAAE